MKGFTPNFQDSTELNTKSPSSFIELGIAQCSPNCDCEECASEGGEQKSEGLAKP